MSCTDFVSRLRAFNLIKEAPLFFPSFQAAYTRINALFEVYCDTGLAQNLVIIGQTGDGKSTLAAAILRQHPKHRGTDRDIVPVVYARIPPGATIGGTAEAILMGLGDFSPANGSAATKTQRIATLARGCDVRLLIIDEAQHLYDRGKSYTHYHVGDWLKALVDMLAIPVVLIGLPRTVQLLHVNEQLRRRFTEMLQISLPSGSTQDCAEGSLRTFVGLCDGVEITIDYEVYDWAEWGERLWYASDGRIGYLSQLLLGILLSREDKGRLEIRLNDLEMSFARYLWRDVVPSLNPFSLEFTFRQLNRPGEPFGPDVAAADKLAKVAA